MSSMYDYAPREIHELPFTLKRSQLYPVNPPAVDQGIEFYAQGVESAHHMPQATGFTKWKSGLAAQDFAGPARSAVEAAGIRQRFVGDIVNPIVNPLPIYTQTMAANTLNRLPVYDDPISSTPPIARDLMDRPILQAQALNSIAFQAQNLPWGVSPAVEQKTFLQTAEYKGFSGLGSTRLGAVSPAVSTTLGVLGLLAVGASAYHGYKRNNSVAWGVGWGLLGVMFPIITVPVALAQGFGKRKGR